MRGLITIAGALFLGGTAAAQPAGNGPGAPACSLQIEAAPGAVWLIPGFDPFSNSAAHGTYSLTFRNRGTTVCRFTPVFRLDGGEPFGLRAAAGDRLTYSLRDTTRGLNATPQNGRSRPNSQLGQLEIAPGSQMSLNYDFIVDADSIRDDGEYSQTVTVEAEESDFDVVGGTMIRLGLEVLPSARIGLAGSYTVSDGHALVNLGELREGPAPVPLQLRVNSTGRYAVTISSANGGRLRLGATDWYVPYSLSVGGNSVNLSGADTLTGPNGSGFRRDALPIHFRIGDVSDRSAGTYSDVISISVAAR